MKKYSYKKSITAEEVDDIIESALYSGISYWASDAEVKMPQGVEITYMNEVLTNGGKLYLRDEDGKRHMLDIKKFMRGLNMYKGSLEDVDAAIADEIVQLAVFGKVTYG